MKQATIKNKVYIMRDSQPTTLPITNFVTNRQLYRTIDEKISMPTVIPRAFELMWITLSLSVVSKINLRVHGMPRHMNMSNVFAPMALHMAIDAIPKLVIDS